ncbi:uncharacterized protein EHS24_000183 [Apiotrichum porosum]|uniref:Pentacotripeptide-repeat region of PRORP domain-containing protein n=1 Tax=Apiotrichum porosum TaxID=105984 RepID=A0A427Y962_9TREE|nr:uncharacterized protein EHS24_000183 [Apiotrichum porosum]RSH87669.1 hypothetical protein EHS24_000183 [Apiotrichum porosum]
MLTKAATHIRPLLRLHQTAHAQPDLFTSNPSLLHHFQGPGVSNTLVAAQTAQAASGSSGAAGGAGRSGYSGASNGGGYTGHARAFLSLPQGPAADATSVSSSSDDKQQDAATARQLAHLQLKQRITSRRDESPPVRTVMLRDQMAARAGSRPVTLIEMEPVAEEPMSPKRSTIAYPAWAALPDNAAAGGALWLPGAAPRPMGARAFSTRTRPTAQLVSSVPTPDQSRIDQPNRVLMDLAGLDIGRPVSPIARGAGRVRRNSTHSHSAPSSDSHSGVLPAQSVELDNAIRNAIGAAFNAGDREIVHKLIEHYRLPRTAEAKFNADPSLAKYPLPNDYSTATYDRCIQTLMSLRSRGESIAPILDCYNEMLERDVLPSVKTINIVIDALCRRDEDVSLASHRWARHTAWQAFKRDQLHIATEETPADHAASDAIEAYQSEHNFSSALRLLIASPRKLETMDESLLTAARASMGLPFAPTMESAVTVLQNAVGRSSRLSIFADTFDILSYGTPKQLSTVSTYWKLFETKLKAAASLNKDLTRDSAEIQETYLAAIRAFVAVGETKFAKELAQSANDRHDKGKYLGALINGSCKHGDLDLAWESFNAGRTACIPTEDLYELTEALAKAGRAEDTVTVMRHLMDDIATDRPGQKIERARILRAYGYLLGYAINSEDPAVRDAALTGATDIHTVSFPRCDTAVVLKHIELLIAAGRFTDIPHVLIRYARRETNDVADICDMIGVTACSPAPISVVLDTVRAAARLDVQISSKVMKPVTPHIIDKYSATRTTTAVQDLGLTHDQWFRLLDTFNALPREYIEANTATVEGFFTDLAVVQQGRIPLPASFVNSPAASKLANTLTGLVGNERSAELLTAAFGANAAVLLPTPAASAGSSAPSFTLPPTPMSADAPPSTLQPASAHTLHFSGGLNAMIERMSYGQPGTGNIVTPTAAYTAVRQGLANNEVPSPENIGRLIVTIARTGDEPKVNELYSLAQVVLASCVPKERAQARGWCAVEDAMITARCYLGHLEQAGMHRARIIEAGMAPTADAYATMIASSRDSTDDALVARELFDESQALGVVPHLYLYNTIISKLSKARKAEVALELFNHMKAAGIRPSSVTYGAVINACCRVGDAESAAVLFEEMSSQPNFKPRVPPFNTMMQFHLQTRPSRDRVLYYYEAMRNAGVRPSAHTYKLLLDAYGTLPTVDLAAMERVFGDLCADRHVAVQGTHWASLITAYGLHSGDVERALEVFEGIAKHPSTKPGSAPEPVVWEAILNVLGQRGTLEQLDAFRTRMTAQGARSTAYVCNVLIAGYARHSQFHRAREVFESMADSLTGVAAPNNHPALLTSSGHAKPSAVTVEPTNVVYREPSTYEAMVRAELKAEDRTAAEDVLRRMQDRRYPVAVWMKARAILDEVVL